MIWEESWEEGKEEGKEEGREEGAARVNKLNGILIDMNRFEDLKCASKDKAFQLKLMLELMPGDI